MPLDTKSLKELEEIATILRRLIRDHPSKSKLERAELWEVEQWIELRLKEKQSAPATAA